MADTLKIDIDVAAAKTALTELSKSFSGFVQTASSAATNAGTAIGKLNAAMLKIKAIDSSVLTSLQTLNTTIAGLNAGSISAVTAALQSFGGSAGGVASTATALQSAQEALKQIKAPDGLDRVSVSFGKVGVSAVQANAHVKAFEANNRMAQNAARALGTELVNAAGFMTGLGVTAGKAISSLNQLTATGQTVGSTLRLMVQEFGAFGTAAAVTAGVAIALKSVYDAASAVISPIVDITTQFNNLETIIDTIDGSGAGAKTLEALRGIANRTAQDIKTLTGNYTQFRIANEGAGISAEQSLTIFEQFSGALRATGASTQKTEKAFLALTQMFSKGKVQAEELRGQLGDALPGALGFAAEALGVTTMELDNMLKTGQVLAKDLIPALGELLNSKFGDAVASQATKAAGQMTIFGNSITLLITSMGNGALGGVLGGVAAGFARLNSAIDSAMIKVFATTLGDLIGLLTNIVLSTLAGVVNGFTAFFDIIALGASYFAKLVQPITDFIGYLTKTNSIMGAVSQVFYVAGTALGVLAASFVVTRAAALALTTALAVQTIVGYASALTGAGASLGTLRAALSAATTSLIAWGAAEVSVSGGLRTMAATISGSLLGALNSLRSGYAAAGGASGLLVAGLAGLRTAVTSVIATIVSFSSAILRAFSLLANPAVAVLVIGLATLGGAVYKATEGFTNFSKVFSSVVGEGEKVVTFASQLKDSLASLQGEAAKTPQSIIAMVTAFQTVEGATSSAKQSIAALDQQMKINESSYGDNAEAIKELNEPLKQQKEALELWGVALSNGAQTAAQTFVEFGKGKEEAAGLALQIQNLTQTEQQRADALAQQSEKAGQYLDFLKQQVDAVKSASDADRAAYESGQLSKELYDSRSAASAALVSTLGKEVSATGNLKAGTDALILSMQNGAPISENLATVANELGLKYGFTADQTKALSVALGEANPALAATGSASDTTAEQQGELATKLGETKTKLGETATAATTTGEALTTANAGFAALAESTTSLGTNLTTVQNQLVGVSTEATTLVSTLPIVVATFGEFTVAAGALASALPPVNTEMDKLKVTTGELQSTLPSVATTFAELSASVSETVEPITSIVAELTKIPPLASGINETANTIKTLDDAVKSADEGFVRATETLGQLAEAGDKVKTGFGNAGDAASNFISQLDSVSSAVSSLITLMNSLKSAAEAALSASARARSEGGGGGQRYGGFSEENFAKSTVPTKFLDSAPQFREGTANTSSQVSKMPGGGIPSILHPNEAVVPLPRGRKIPVDLNLTGLLDTKPVDAPDMSYIKDVSMSLQSVSKSLNSVSDALARPQSISNMSMPTINPIIEVSAPAAPTVQQLDQSPQRLANLQSPNGLDTAAGSRSINQTTSNETVNAPVSVTINIKSEDVDGFNRSQDQIVRSLSDKIRRANRRNG